MKKGIIFQLRALLAFLKLQEGGVAIIFAVTLIPMLAIISISVETGGFVA